jgi:hypothetical protein
MAQQASETLHSLLASKWVCNTQVDHEANLSLDVGMPQYSIVPGTDFRLSMTCISQSSATRKDTVWLKIKSTRNETNQAEEQSSRKAASNVADLTGTLMELGIITGSSKNKRLSVPAGSIPPTIPVHERDSNTILTAPSFIPPVEKLCAYFHSLQAQHPAISNNSAVYTERTSKFEHVVYRCPTPSGYANRTLSLKQILANDANLKKRETWASKFKLARLLTLGVLRFQSTPWFTGTLNSSDICFLENEPHAENQVYSLEDPFLHAQLSRDTSNQRLKESKACHLAQNELLFNLGVILLELGYDAHLQYLRCQEDIRDGAMEACWYTDFYTARRLGTSAARELDARYGRLAKKCLNCDFGVGDNLNSVELQCAVMMNIVNELDKCIKLDEEINSILLS